PLLCSSALRLPPSSTLFPYTTLFRSRLGHDVHGPAQRPCLLAHRRRDLGEDVRRAGVEDRVDGVEPEPVDVALAHPGARVLDEVDRKSTRLNSSHVEISYAVFCLKKK